MLVFSAKILYWNTSVDRFSNCESAKYCEYQCNVHQNRRYLQRNVAARVASSTRQTDCFTLSHEAKTQDAEKGTWPTLIFAQSAAAAAQHLVFMCWCWICIGSAVTDETGRGGVGTLWTSPRAGTSHHYSAIIGHWPPNTTETLQKMKKERKKHKLSPVVLKYLFKMRQYIILRFLWLY